MDKSDMQAKRAADLVEQVLADRPLQGHVAVAGRCRWTGRRDWWRYLKSKRGTRGYVPTSGDHTPQPPWLLERGVNQ